jgi:hypothetical protein
LGGAALLAVKSVAILVTGAQPPWLFEVSPVLLGLAVVGLCRLPTGSDAGAAQRIGVVLGAVAVLAGLVAVGTELVGTVWGAALGVSYLAATVGVGIGGRTCRTSAPSLARATLATAVATVPLLGVGGLLAVLDERLLEIGLLAIAVLWAWVGSNLLRAAAVNAELG